MPPKRPQPERGAQPDRRALEDQIAALRELREAPDSPATVSALRAALADRNNYLVSKAAAIAGDLRLLDLTPDLARAFHRFLEDGAKKDPQCWAKNATAKALKDLEYEDPALYIAGIRHVQPEPVWGGTEDTAITLRGTCALGLVLCRSVADIEILRYLTDLLVDAAVPVRQDAARAIAQLGRVEGALLLRLKIRSKDEPEVIGQCFSALLSLEEKEAIPLIRGYLNHESEDLQFEAAGALGGSTSVEAYEALLAAYQRARAVRFRQGLLLAIGATRRPEAVEFLLQLVQPADLTTASQAIAALAPSLMREEVQGRAEAVVRQTGSSVLLAALHKALGG